MEVRIVGQRAAPVRVDIRHVFPLGKVVRKCVEQAFLGIVDFGDAQDVVDVRDEGDALCGDEVGGRISGEGVVGIHVEALHVIGCVTR